MENNVNLSEVLRLHELWAEGNPDGEQADLREADLREADLREADLRETGCVSLLVEKYACWITPDSCCIGCEKHTHDFWRTVSMEDVEKMEVGAGLLWQQ